MKSEKQKTFFKLKREARQFFKANFWDQVRSLEWWKLNGIPIELLQETPRIYINCGHAISPSNTSLSSYDSATQEGRFHFTIYANGITSEQYHFISGENTSILLDALQETIDSFFTIHTSKTT